MAVLRKLADKEVNDILMKHVCPAIGALLSNLIIVSPMKSFRRAILRGRLGDLNPVPFAILTGNILGWISYAFMKKDIYLLIANAPGLFITLWYNAGAIKLQYSESLRKEENNIQPEGNENYESVPSEDYTPPLDETDSSSSLLDKNLVGKLLSNQEILLTISIFVWIIILCVVTFSSFTHHKKIDIIGVSATVNLVLFYAAPLSTIWKVIQARDSSSIHRPLLIMMFLGSNFWFVYGLAMLDPFITFPNGCGILLNIVQGSLCVIYPSKETVVPS